MKSKAKTKDKTTAKTTKRKDVNQKQVKETKKALGKFFTSGVISFMIDEAIAVTKGEQDSLATKDMTVRGQLWDIAEKMLIKESELMHIKAQSTRDLITAVCEGRMTLQDAEKLSSIMHNEWEQTELPKLLEKFEALQK